MWNVSWLCNRFSHKQRRATESRNHQQHIFFLFFFYFIQELTHSHDPPRLFNYQKKKKNHCTSACFYIPLKGNCEFVGWHRRSTYVIAGQRQVVARYRGLISLFASLTLRKPNLLTHIHHTLLCTGLKCVWERERLEKKRKKNAFGLLCNAEWVGKKTKKNTCSVGQPLQL